MAVFVFLLITLACLAHGQRQYLINDQLFQTKVYLFDGLMRNFSEAVQFCEDHSGMLVKIQSKNEINFLVDNFKLRSKAYVGIASFGRGQVPNRYIDESPVIDHSWINNNDLLFNYRDGCECCAVKLMPTREPIVRPCSTRDSVICQLNDDGIDKYMEAQDLVNIKAVIDNNTKKLDLLLEEFQSQKSLVDDEIDVKNQMIKELQTEIRNVQSELVSSLNHHSNCVTQSEQFKLRLEEKSRSCDLVTNQADRLAKIMEVRNTELEQRVSELNDKLLASESIEKRLRNQIVQLEVARNENSIN